MEPVAEESPSTVPYQSPAPSSSSMVLPSISPGLEQHHQGPTRLDSSSTAATLTRSNSSSLFGKVRLPTLHPELEGYTPGEFSIRISQDICEGLSSHIRHLNSVEPSPSASDENNVQKSIQKFEDIMRKREDMSTSARQRHMAKSRVSGNSATVQTGVNRQEKHATNLRIQKRTDTMRSLISSNMSVNKSTPAPSSRKCKHDRILPKEQHNMETHLGLQRNEDLQDSRLLPRSGLVRKHSTQNLPTATERCGSCSIQKRRSVRQNSEITYRVRQRLNRRMSMVPLDELRRIRNPSCRFNNYGEAKYFFIKTVKMVTTLKKWWTEFSRKYQSVEYQMKTFLDIAKDIEDVSLSGSQTREEPGLKFDPKYFKASREIGISRDVMLILCMRPHQRTKEQIQKVVHGLQSLQAYAEYPLYMQEQLAKVAYYQEITPKRVIVRQGHTPENFYFILSGHASVKVIVRDGSNVSVNVVATLKKGQSFGEIALLHNSCRTATVESVSCMKLLSIWKDDFLEIFFKLKSDIEPEHISFCRDIPFLKHWPIKEIMRDPSNCFSHYFRRGAVVVPDSNKNDWIYIIKTGSCRILKRLKAVDPYKTWDKRRTAQNDHIHDFVSEQKEGKTNSGLNRHRAVTVEAAVGRAMTEFFLTKDAENTAEGDFGSSPAELVAPAMSEHTPVLLEDTPERGNKLLPTPSTSSNLTSLSKSPLKSFLSQCKVKREPLPIITECPKQKTKPYVNPSKPARQCYITLKKLLPKDAFGLESVEFEDEQYDRPKVSLILVSDGSEIVIISKKVFVKFANEFVRQYVREHVQYYPSEDILQENLQTEMNWDMYKDEVLHDTMEKLRVTVY